MMGIVGLPENFHWFVSNEGKVEQIENTKGNGMYERFTDRARRVMQLANQEAQRFNHEYIHVEHILIGMVKEGANIGAHALLNVVNANLRRYDKEHLLSYLRSEMLKMKPEGSDMVMMGRLPHTPKVKDMIVRAMEIAQEWKHGYIGTEHILMAIVTDKDLETCAVLRAIGINPDDVRDEILKLMGKGESKKGSCSLKDGVGIVQEGKSIWEQSVTPPEGAKEFKVEARYATEEDCKVFADAMEAYRGLPDEYELCLGELGMRLESLKYASDIGKVRDWSPVDVVQAAQMFYNFLSEKTEGKEC